MKVYAVYACPSLCTLKTVRGCVSHTSLDLEIVIIAEAAKRGLFPLGTLLDGYLTLTKSHVGYCTFFPGALSDHLCCLWAFLRIHMKQEKITGKHMISKQLSSALVTFDPPG